ncbi:MAG: hypothetical protein B7Y40_01865 [Gammaproteobacteria bacterium 28-57-27]|nr:MAG: hypothetical protein B7Y40_01865 [Gammaproteobacteria bacterium 28-57-27]
MPVLVLKILQTVMLALSLGLGFASAVYAEIAPAKVEVVNNQQDQPVALPVARIEIAPASVRAQEVEKLQDRLIELEKETAVLKAELSTRIDAQDNRISDGIGLHGAKVTELSNQTSMLGVLITGVTILVAIGGIFGGFFAFRRAKEIAKEESAQWFAENDEKLRKEIDRLAAKAQHACDTIDKHREGVVASSKEFEQLGAELKAKIGSFSVEGIDVSENREMQLENKPRTDWTAADFGAYGYFLFQKGEYEDALLALEEQIEQLDRSAQAEDRLLLATALLNKGDLLVELDRLPEAIVTYDAVVQRTDGLNEPGFSERLARAMVHKGVALSKQKQFDSAIKAYDEAVQRIKSLNEPDLRDWVVTALGGKSVLLIQLGRIKQAKDVLVILTEQFNDLEKPNAQQLVKISRLLLRSLGGVSE